jgi:hypothetical protein
MMRCIAYRPSRNCVHAWTVCKNRAEKGAMFCKSHLRAICGVYLGLCVTGFPERMSTRKATPRSGPSGSKHP